MDKSMMDLIKRIAENINKKGNVRNVIGTLKGVTTLNDFKDFIMDNIEDEDGSIITSEEYMKLTNRFKWKDIKNLLLIEIL